MPQHLRMNIRRKGRSQMVVNYARTPPKPKLRRRVRPHRLKTTVLSKIPGTRGIWSKLAERLGCAISTVQRMMRQPGWEWVLEAFQEEKQIARDRVTGNLYHLALNSPSHNVQLAASQFIAERTNPEFQKHSKMTVEGGDKPIKHVMLNITPEQLETLSTEERIHILEMTDGEITDPGN